MENKKMNTRQDRIFFSPSLDLGCCHQSSRYMMKYLSDVSRCGDLGINRMIRKASAFSIFEPGRYWILYS